MKRAILWVVLITLCLAMCGCATDHQVSDPNGTTGQVPGINHANTGKEYADVIDSYVNSGDYSGAIQYYNSLSSSIQSQSSVAAAYINALSSYKTDVIRKVEQYIASADFTAARSLLTVAGNQIGNDATLSAKLKEVNEQELLQTVQVYDASGNYAAAITYLNQNQSIVSGSMELQVKLETYKEQYRTAVIAQATDAYEKDGYASALSVLNNALKVMPNDGTFIAEKERYEKAVPVSLAEVDVIQQNDYYFVDTDSYRKEYMYGKLRSNLSKVSSDVNGVAYDADGVHFIACFRTEKNSSSSNSITYFLNQQYDVLTGVVYRPYVTLYCTVDWTSDGIVEIYGDGVLLYIGSVTQQTVDAFTFDVNVSGVRELRIVLKGWWMDPEWTEDYYSPKLCLADLKVSKEP